jgi:hypothetical protein
MSKDGKVKKQAQQAARDAAGDDGGRAHLGWLLLGAGLGSLTTYLLDPDRGRRRQALLRDQVVHAGAVVRTQAPQKLRHAQNRLQGIQHELGGALGKSKAGASDGEDEGPTSPEWEIAHNDDGSLTGPSY